MKKLVDIRFIFIAIFASVALLCSCGAGAAIIESEGGTAARQFAPGEFKITLLDEIKLTDEGLFFDGVKGVNYQFGNRITPHGDCIDYADGYVFVTWYKGGMDKRNLMLSRMKIGSGEWKTIEFPDQHIGYRGNKIKGDSHNTAAIGICPIDNTIHIIYDIHAYDAKSFPDNYFNYRVSTKNAISVPDSEWNIALFSAKRNYLNPAIHFEKTTYPEFDRMDDGRLVVKLRFGGSGQGNHTFAIYDGNGWPAKMTQFNEGVNHDELDKYSIYGGFKYIHGKYRAGFAIRYKNNAKRAEKYELNSGLFYAATSIYDAATGWKTFDNKSIQLPIVDPGVIQIGEPCDLGFGKRISSSPAWTVTKNEAVHFLTSVGNKNVHYYTGPNSKTFTHTIIPFSGELYSFGDRVLMIGLDQNKRPFVKSTAGGTNDWVDIYKTTSGKTYRHCNVELIENKIFIYLMEAKLGQAQPLDMVTLIVGTTNDIDGDGIQNTDDAEPMIYNKAKS